MEKATVIHMSHSAEIQVYPRSNAIIVLHTYDSVSYTHLDVYKRQIPDTVNRSLSSSRRVGAMFTTRKVSRNILSFLLCKSSRRVFASLLYVTRSGGSMSTVSYTHLDVDKRQQHHRTDQEQREKGAVLFLRLGFRYFLHRFGGLWLWLRGHFFGRFLTLFGKRQKVVCGCLLYTSE